MATKDSVRAITLRTFNAANLLAAVWQPITPVGGLPQSCFKIMIRNASDRDIFISYNNTDRNDYMIADSELELYFQPNSLPSNSVALLKRGTVISLRGTPGGAGTIYLSGYYQEEL